MTETVPGLDTAYQPESCVSDNLRKAARRARRKEKRAGKGTSEVRRKDTRTPLGPPERWNKLSSRQKAILRSAEGDDSLFAEGIEPNPGPRDLRFEARDSLLRDFSRLRNSLLLMRLSGNHFEVWVSGWRGGVDVDGDHWMLSDESLVTVIRGSDILFHSWLNLISTLPHEHPLWIALSRTPMSMWMRDLTREGVEPNPGPPKVWRAKGQHLDATAPMPQPPPGPLPHPQPQPPAPRDAQPVRRWRLKPAPVQGPGLRPRPAPGQGPGLRPRPRDPVLPAVMPIPPAEPRLPMEMQPALEYPEAEPMLRPEVARRRADGFAFPKEPADKICRNCGARGHIARRCPRAGNQQRRAAMEFRLRGAVGVPVAVALNNVPQPQPHHEPDKEAVQVVEDLRPPFVVGLEDAEFPAPVQEAVVPILEDGNGPDEPDFGEPQPMTVVYRPDVGPFLFYFLFSLVAACMLLKRFSFGSVLVAYLPFIVFLGVRYLCRWDTVGELPPQHIAVRNDIRNVYLDMQDKTSTRLWTRDLTSKPDLTNVRRDLVPIARSAKLYEKLGADALPLMERAFTNGFNIALDARLRKARNKLRRWGALYWFKKGFSYEFPNPVFRFKTAVEELSFLDSVDACDLGLYPTAWVACISGCAVRLLGVPLFEEVGRRQVLRTIRMGLDVVFGRAQTTDYVYHGFVLGVALLFVVVETKGNFSFGEFFRALLRLSLHFLLGQVAVLRTALAIHLSWNICSRVFRWQTHLDVFDDFSDPFSKVLSDVCVAQFGLKCTKTQSGFKQEPGDQKCEPHFGVRRFWGFSFSVPTVFRSCTCNEQVAITGRVGKELPMHNNAATIMSVRNKWAHTTERLSPYLLRKLKRVRRPVHLQKWLSSYPPRRRADFQRAIDREQDVVQQRAKSFIKREIAPKYIHNLRFKDPRFIQGCPVELSLLTGPWLRKLAKNTREGLNGGLFTGETLTQASILSGNHIGYTCGLNANEIGHMYGCAIDTIAEMVGPDNVVIIEDDQSRFDLHLTQGPFMYLDALYTQLLPTRVACALRRGMSRGVSCFGTKYQIPYTMQSGWPDTSIGDTLVNAAMKLEIHGIGRPWFSIICGDDSVTITSVGELERIGGVDVLVHRYSEYGMEVEAKVSHHPLDVEFCSGRFYPLVDGSYVLMPKPGRFLAKIFCDTVDRKKVDQDLWVRSVVDVVANYGLVDPLCAALAQSIRLGLSAREATTDSKLTAEFRYSREHNPVVSGKVISDYYLYYHRNYDLSSSDVDELIQLLLDTCLGETVSDIRFERMFSVDVGL